MIEQLAPLVADVGPPLAPGALDTGYLAQLPESHRQMLVEYNGFSVFHGTYRMFGVRRDDELDLVRWNDLETWRFAWSGRVGPFLCIGESAWGDQYAYKFSSDGDLKPGVYFLQATFLKPELIAASFDEFFEAELLRVAVRPYDSVMLEAVERFGQIDAQQHWVFSPPRALGGPADLDNVVLMTSSIAMTFSGDVVTDLMAASENARPTGMEPWVDDAGRARVRVQFSTAD